MTTSAERFGDDFGAERMWGLKELALPDTASLWPLAPGWFVVVGMLLLALAFIGWRFYRRWQAAAYRRTGLAELEKFADARALPRILRAAALNAYPRAEVAALRGDAWIDWLNTTAGQPVYVPGDAQKLDALTYAPTCDLSDVEIQRLREGAKTWLLRHGTGQIRAHV